MTDAPRPRRRARRTLSSVALRLLRAVIDDADYSTFSSVPVGVLSEDESEIYQFVSRYYARYSRFPSMEHLQEQRINLPEAQDPIAQYRDQLQDSIRRSQAADIIIGLQEALEGGDMERLGDLLVQRRDVGISGELSLLTMAQLTERFITDLEPMNSLVGLVETGIPALDREVGGVKQGNIMALAARPGVGKTFLQLIGAMNLARAGRPILYVSREMTPDEVAHRILTMHYDVDPSMGLTRRVSTYAYEQLRERLSDGLPDWIEENFLVANPDACGNVSDITSLMRSSQPVATFVDGTYFVKPSQRMNFSSRTERYEQLIRELREAAYETNRTIMMTWQQNRTKAMGTEGLYGTDALSQDASLVVMMKALRKHKNMRVGEVAKNRHGPEGATIGMSYEFKPTRVGLPVSIPGGEERAANTRERHIENAVRTSAAPNRVEMPDD